MESEIGGQPFDLPRTEDGRRGETRAQACRASAQDNRNVGIEHVRNDGRWKNGVLNDGILKLRKIAVLANTPQRKLGEIVHGPVLSSLAQFHF